MYNTKKRMLFKMTSHTCMLTIKECSRFYSWLLQLSVDWVNWLITERSCKVTRSVELNNILVLQFLIKDWLTIIESNIACLIIALVRSLMYQTQLTNFHQSLHLYNNQYANLLVQTWPRNVPLSHQDSTSLLGAMTHSTICKQ